jgi:hypothetical protein
MFVSRLLFPADQAFRIGFDIWALSFEAAAVVTLRSMKLAAGGAEAQAEAGLMVSEKVAAMADLQARQFGAGLQTPAAATRRALSHYRRRVRANRKRLALT